MRIWVVGLFAFVISALGINTVAFAQEAPASPALQAPAAPTAPAHLTTTVNSSTFPQLPASTPCKRKDIRGVWKLVAIHEQPQGQETRDFTASPLQFLHFAKNDTYKSIKRVRRVRNRRAFNNLFKLKPGDPLQQYVVNETGFLYLYRDGNVVDTRACFIVADNFASFKKGQMLLMPPAPLKGQAITSRLLKVYKNLFPKPPRRSGSRSKRKKLK